MKILQPKQKNKNTVTKPEKRERKQVRRKLKKKAVGIQHYDPRKDISGDKSKSSVVWTTHSASLALDAISVGRPLKKSPFFENNPKLRKQDLVFRTSDVEVLELAKCVTNMMYFAREYVQLKQRDGSYQRCTLYPHQMKQLVSYLSYGKHIQAWSRQASKTTSAAIYILWNVLFHKNRQCAILSNKQKTSNEVLDKIKEIYYRLPFWMKAGVELWNEKFIKFDNGCSILAAPCTKDAINGKTIHTLYIDEFSFCFDGNKEKQSDFLSNAIPAQAQIEDPKLIITSTPNGKDLFYELYDESVKGKNAYRSSTVYWWQIPNRDVEWATEMINTIGLQKFKIQFEMSFDTKLNKLLSAFTMRELEQKKNVFVNHELKFEGIERYSEKIRFRPNLVNTKKEHYLILIDLAEGMGGDSTTAHFLSLKHKKRNDLNCQISFKQDFVLEANDVPLESEMPELIVRTISTFTKLENVRIIIEWNTYGSFFMAQIQEAMQRLGVLIPPSCFLRFTSRNTSRENSRRRGGRPVGIRTDRKIKKLSVNAFKLAMENSLFDIRDSKTIEQIGFFQVNKKGTYQAELGHDDNVVPYLHLGYTILTRNIGLMAFIEQYLTLQGLGGIKSTFAYNFDDLRNRLKFDDS